MNLTSNYVEPSSQKEYNSDVKNKTKKTWRDILMMITVPGKSTKVKNILAASSIPLLGQSF